MVGAEVGSGSAEAVAAGVEAVGTGEGGGLVRPCVGVGRVGSAVGAALIGGATMTGGGATTGDGVGVLAVGVGVGAGRRDSGTSGATGPCRSGGGCCSDGSGRRKSLTAACAGTSGAARAAATAKARNFERISVAADMEGGAV